MSQTGKKVTVEDLQKLRGACGSAGLQRPSNIGGKLRLSLDAIADRPMPDGPANPRAKGDFQ
jgi:hypothetical protein